MATQQDQLIQAIRRIAKSDPEIRSVLTALQKRGALDGLVKLVGGSDAAALEDCCTDSDEADPEEGDPEDISEDAPPTVPDIGDEDGDGETDWFNCETEEPITFTPGGFPRPETCKECERPDPTWQSGYKWKWSGMDSRVPTAMQAANNFLAFQESYRASQGYTCGFSIAEFTPNEMDSDGSIQGYYVKIVPSGECAVTYSTTRVYRSLCFAGDYTSGVCTNEPPLIDDCQDWEPDGATNYTLADGCITASSCDPDASAASQACNECITICNAEGQERRVCAIGNGQWILYDPSGQFKGGRYDATGRRLEVLDKGETGGYLPSEAYDGSYDGGTIGGGVGWVWS